MQTDYRGLTSRDLKLQGGVFLHQKLPDAQAFWEGHVCHRTPVSTSGAFGLLTVQAAELTGLPDHAGLDQVSHKRRSMAGRQQVDTVLP